MILTMNEYYLVIGSVTCDTSMKALKLLRNQKTHYEFYDLTDISIDDTINLQNIANVNKFNEIPQIFKYANKEYYYVGRYEDLKDDLKGN